MKNIRSYRKIVRETGIGEAIYCNAINFSMAMIEALRSDIQNGVLKPDQKALDEIIKKEAQPRYIDGTSICPQMTYIKCQ